VVVSVAGSFIAAIEPMAGMKKFTDTAPTSTGFPPAFANVKVNVFLPLRSTPSELDNVAVRLLPAGPLLMVFPLESVPALLHENVKTDKARNEIIANSLVMICS
jgi:hypothetical protein